MSEAVLRAFCTAFEQRDIQALSAALHEQALAQVVGAPFPIEEGREAIAATSLPYLLATEGLAAIPATVEGSPGIVLRTNAGTGPIDMAIAIEADDQCIRRLDYITEPHEPVRLHAVGRDLGLPTTADPDPAT